MLLGHMIRYQNLIDHRFAALADPTQRAMVERLSRKKRADPVQQVRAGPHLRLETGSAALH